MNRPKLEDYKAFVKDGLIIPRLAQYTVDLEKYCDEMENTIDNTLRVSNDIIGELAKEVLELERALDKACEKLAFTSNKHCIDELGSFTLGEINRTKKQWKEWLMNDD